MLDYLRTPEAAYYCEIIHLSEQAQKTLPDSAVVYVAIALNFMLISFIWCFIWLSSLYFAYARKDLGTPALNVLMGCFVVLASWFFFRAYSQWYQWYGDLSHIRYYFPYWVLLVFAVALLVLFLIWTLTEHMAVSIYVAIPSVYGALAALFAAVAGINPSILTDAFWIVSGMPAALYGLLLIGAVMTLAVYARALLVQD